MLADWMGIRKSQTSGPRAWGSSAVGLCPHDVLRQESGGRPIATIFHQGTGSLKMRDSITCVIICVQCRWSWRGGSGFLGSIMQSERIHYSLWCQAAYNPSHKSGFEGHHRGQAQCCESGHRWVYIEPPLDVADRDTAADAKAACKSLNSGTFWRFAYYPRRLQSDHVRVGIAYLAVCVHQFMADRRRRRFRKGESITRNR